MMCCNPFLLLLEVVTFQGSIFCLVTCCPQIWFSFVEGGKKLYTLVVVTTKKEGGKKLIKPSPELDNHLEVDLKKKKKPASTG